MRTGRVLHHLVLRTLNARSASGTVEAGWLRLPCAIGRGGVSYRKREGDGATPAGRLPLRAFYYRADRVGRAFRQVARDLAGAPVVRPVTRGRLGLGMPSRALRRDDGWCDAVGDRNYNRHVRHPYPASAERMWREDGLYDIVVVMGWNDRPRIKGRGSAIFLHCASPHSNQPGYRPTEGCIALAKADLARLLPMLGRRTKVVVGM